LIDAYTQWSLTLNEKWGGLIFIFPTYLTNATTSCKGNWTVSSRYIYQGSQNDTEFIKNWNILCHLANGTPTANTTITYATWWEYVRDPVNLEHIYPEPNLYVPNTPYPGGIPSVLVNRETVSNGQLANALKFYLPQCLNATGYCPTSVQLYQDITGNLNSPQDMTTAVNIGMRTSLFHLVIAAAVPMDIYYKLGANSYFSESAYEIDNWQERLFGDHFDELLTIKETRDPRNLFWCRHCVGDTD